jgi:hypothetical protein
MSSHNRNPTGNNHWQYGDIRTFKLLFQVLDFVLLTDLLFLAKTDDPALVGEGHELLDSLPQHAALLLSPSPSRTSPAGGTPRELV